MLAIVVVNQSIMEWPPLQDNRLSTRPASFRNTLRQGPISMAEKPHKNRSRANLQIKVGGLLGDCLIPDFVRLTVLASTSQDRTEAIPRSRTTAIPDTTPGTG